MEQLQNDGLHVGFLGICVYLPHKSQFCIFIFHIFSPVSVGTLMKLSKNIWTFVSLWWATVWSFNVGHFYLETHFSCEAAETEDGNIHHLLIDGSVSICSLNTLSDTKWVEMNLTNQTAKIESFWNERKRVKVKERKFPFKNWSYENHWSRTRLWKSIINTL